MVGLVPSAWIACRLPNSNCHGWPQLWLPRAWQLAAPSTTCGHALSEGNLWQACQACARGASAGLCGGSPRSGPHTRRNTTSAPPAQVINVATGNRTNSCFTTPLSDSTTPLSKVSALAKCRPATAVWWFPSILISDSSSLCWIRTRPHNSLLAQPIANNSDNPTPTKTHHLPQKMPPECYP
jgi:hypothetical protein